ncbi:MBL fold metallo-hydrolase [Rhodococcus sp. 077-4]|uniref:MBL fold metallo-hydrolase n=1 Tax=Rhodococcus sp. 077-4 TaxID=2789271 RepID=UPI0039F5AC5E
MIAAAQPDSLPTPSFDEIAPAVWAWVQPDGSWWINNTGVIAGDDGDVIVDTCATAQRTQAFLRARRRAHRSDTPIRFALNTHQHGDHTYGNSQLPESTVIIGQRHMRAGLATDTVICGCPPFWEPVPQWGDVSLRLPSVSFDRSMELHLGDRIVELHHPGYTAHTTGDAVAWLPAERVLFAGDLVFNGVTPLAFMGSLTGALQSLDWLREFDAEIIVPGHGPVIERSGIDDALEAIADYYRYVQNAGQQGYLLGMTPLDAARTAGLGDYAAMPDAERLVLNIHRHYADMSGTELDIIAAFADAVSFNGGPMTSNL